MKKNEKSVIGKIYKTTDGFLDGKPHIKKPRRIVVLKQRNSDYAVGVSKIFSKKEKKNKNIIQNVVLNPKNHKSLDQKSVVGSRIIIGKKNKNGNYEPFYVSNFRDLNDRLSKRELSKIKKNRLKQSKSIQKTTNKKIKNWNNHFKK